MANEITTSKPRQLVKSDTTVVGSKSDAEAAVSLCEPYNTSTSCPSGFSVGWTCTSFSGIDKENDILF